MKLRPYQEEAADFLYERDRAMILAPVGAGKTAITLTAMNDAILTGVETRTSSPISIKRATDSLQSVNTPGLYPAGEGAGYAGGILSAAVDGIKIAEAVAKDLLA